LIIIYDKYLQI